MIRFAHWPDDARGPLLVISFDGNDDIDRFESNLEELVAGGGDLTLSIPGKHQAKGFTSVRMTLSTDSLWSSTNEVATVALTEPQVGELEKMLKAMKASSVPCHNYLYIGQGLELLITKSEYEPKHFT